MNSKLPAKQRNGIFYKILLKIKQIFRRKKYEGENLESNKVIVNSNNQFKNNIKIDIENIEFNNEYQKQQFMEQLKNNQELLMTVFIISDLQLEKSDEEMKVEVEQAEGQKCERCWMYSKTVGQDKDNPTICNRCSQAIK